MKILISSSEIFQMLYVILISLIITIESCPFRIFLCWCFSTVLQTTVIREVIFWDVYVRRAMLDITARGQYCSQPTYSMLFMLPNQTFTYLWQETMASINAWEKTADLKKYRIRFDNETADVKSILIVGQHFVHWLVHIFASQ